ncbi:MAG: HAD-IIB family hydrolase [Propionibacteriaceae bacterium]|nr:HAD-IIB family hydrolase [Micropruina sp.]HBX80159.1 haloacid dehalogenase [Propionibacteriaceae bacterium]HBY21892.1 haloacid dehalogenase [Propionibacteriaceae bacterium]
MTALLSLDLDGTAVFDRMVSARDKKALDRWRNHGNLLAINTGKSIFATDSVLAPSSVTFDYCICFTGAVVTDAHFRPFQVHYIPPELVAAVVADLATELVNIYATTLDNDWSLVTNIDRPSTILSLFTRMELSAIQDHEFIGVPILALDNTLRDSLAQRLTDRWHDVADCHRNQEFLDLVPVGCNKGTGLRDLLSGPLADRNLDVWSIGDSWNDIEMHQVADHAICLPWSPPEVAAVCERTVDSVADLIDSILGKDPSWDA